MKSTITSQRAANVALAKEQLGAWSAQLDSLMAQSPPTTERIRLEVLRARHEMVKAKLSEFTDAEHVSAPWGPFQADIDDDWKALVAGL